MRSGQLGIVGLMHFSVQYEKFTAQDIVSWVEQDLAPMLNAYPGPQSVVVMDNMPEHRALEQRIAAAIRSRGAMLLWNPPQSPDLNPIEKLWDVAISHANARLVQVLAGHWAPGGASRAFNIGDLILALQDARMSLNAYNDIFRHSY
jgi:hypothetical protein